MSETGQNPAVWHAPALMKQGRDSDWRAADRHAVLHRLYPAHSSTITPPTRIRFCFSRLVPSKIKRFLRLRSSRRTTSSSGACGSASPCTASRSERGVCWGWLARRSSSRRSSQLRASLRRRIKRFAAKATRIATIRSGCRGSFRCGRSRAAAGRNGSRKSPFYTGSTPTCRRPVVGLLP